MENKDRGNSFELSSPFLTGGVWELLKASLGKILQRQFSQFFFCYCENCIFFFFCAAIYYGNLQLHQDSVYKKLHIPLHINVH